MSEWLTPRRRFLQRCGLGFGTLALGDLLCNHAEASAARTHFPGRAKHVIHIFLNGGMSQVDTFDPKPELTRRGGQMLPYENLKTERRTGVALPSPFQFKQHGESGIPVSDLFPHLSKCVDEMAVIRSMYAELPSHEMSLMLMNSGDQRSVRPSFGSWLNWGMGTENENLPGFVALCPGGLPVGGAGNWRSAFLPGVYQGTLVDTAKEDPTQLIQNVRNQRLSAEQQKHQFALLQQLNSRHLSLRPEEADIEARIRSFELAYRMQIDAPEIMNISKETKQTIARYEASPGGSSFANNCLLAKRLLENGVRFVQLFDWGWDVHGTAKHDDLMNHFPAKCRQFDAPLSALLSDLEESGLLKETIVVCAGEFGRTAMNEARNGSKLLGRDHHPDCASFWMAGGGIKPGMTFGATDELGYSAVNNPVHVNDLHATMLYLFGIDHEKLTYRFQGRDFRLTDVSGHVLNQILS